MVENATLAASPEPTDHTFRALRANPPAILTIPEAASVLTVSRRTIMDLLAAGKLASKKIGRRRVILRSGLEKLVGGKLA